MLGIHYLLSYISNQLVLRSVIKTFRQGLGMASLLGHLTLSVVLYRNELFLNQEAGCFTRH